MVYSFNQVLKKIKPDETIVIYSDILFEKKCLSKIIKVNIRFPLLSIQIEKNGKKSNF